MAESCVTGQRVANTSATCSNGASYLNARAITPPAKAHGSVAHFESATEYTAFLMTILGQFSEYAATVAKAEADGSKSPCGGNSGPTLPAALLIEFALDWETEGYQDEILRTGSDSLCPECRIEVTVIRFHADKTSRSRISIPLERLAAIGNVQVLLRTLLHPIYSISHQPAVMQQLIAIKTPEAVDNCQQDVIEDLDDSRNDSFFARARNRWRRRIVTDSRCPVSPKCPTNVWLQPHQYWAKPGSDSTQRCWSADATTVACHSQNVIRLKEIERSASVASGSSLSSSAQAPARSLGLAWVPFCLSSAAPATKVPALPVSSLLTVTTKTSAFCSPILTAAATVDDPASFKIERSSSGLAVSNSHPPRPYLHHVLLWLFRQSVALSRRLPCSLIATSGTLVTEHMATLLSLTDNADADSHLMGGAAGEVIPDRKEPPGLAQLDFVVALPETERWVLGTKTDVMTYENCMLKEQSIPRSWVRKTDSDPMIPHQLQQLCLCYLSPDGDDTVAIPHHSIAAFSHVRDLSSKFGCSASDSTGTISDSLTRRYSAGAASRPQSQSVHKARSGDHCFFCGRPRRLALAPVVGIFPHQSPPVSDLPHALPLLEIPLLSELFPDAGLQSGAEHTQLGDGFRPLGGHGFAWTYSPYRCGTRFLIKRTLPTEGGFYAFLLNQHRADSLSSLATTASQQFGTEKRDRPSLRSLTRGNAKHPEPSGYLSSVVRVETALPRRLLQAGAMISGRLAPRFSVLGNSGIPTTAISPERHPSTGTGLPRSPSAASSTVASESELTERLPLLQECSGNWWIRKFGAEKRSAAIRGLLEFIPYVTGVILPEAAVTEDINGKKLLTNANSCFVEMENLTHVNLDVHTHIPFHCAIDIKIGTQLWGPDADETKRRRMEERAKNSTSWNLGLALIGYRIESPLLGEGHGIQMCRDECRDIDTKEKLHASLKHFFSYASPSMLSTIINKLKELLDWFLHYSVFAHFHASSILIIYDSTEGETAGIDAIPSSDAFLSEDEDVSVPHDVCEPIVKLIDFAHASIYHADLDEGCLLGIRNLLALLETFRQCPTIGCVQREQPDYS